MFVSVWQKGEERDLEKAMRQVLERWISAGAKQLVQQICLMFCLWGSLTVSAAVDLVKDWLRAASTNIQALSIADDLERAVLLNT